MHTIYRFLLTTFWVTRLCRWRRLRRRLLSILFCVCSQVHHCCNCIQSSYRVVISFSDTATALRLFCVFVHQNRKKDQWRKLVNESGTHTFPPHERTSLSKHILTQVSLSFILLHKLSSPDMVHGIWCVDCNVMIIIFWGKIRNFFYFSWRKHVRVNQHLYISNTYVGPS